MAKILVTMQVEDHWDLARIEDQFVVDIIDSTAVPPLSLRETQEVRRIITLAHRDISANI